jgi:hypothetical protein
MDGRICLEYLPDSKSLPPRFPRLTLVTVTQTRKWNPLEELYLAGNCIGVRGFESFVGAMISNRKLRVLDLKKSDLVLEEEGRDSYVPPPDLLTHCGSTHLVYTLPWPLEKKLTFLLCLRSLQRREGESMTAAVRVLAAEDVLVLIFSYLRLPMSRLINLH